ncbi:MAG TPA: response regulator [Myxococcales bacterium]|nr:response regulator [Myxococcales bacterium]
MLRILIVDRDPDTLQALSHMLELEGWNSEAISDPDEALVLLEQNGPYDVVLLDLSLPLPSGLAFVREKERRPAIAAIPVVAMTSDVGVPEALEGVARVLRKPFSIGFAMAALCHAAAYGLESGLPVPPEVLRRA